MWNPSMNNPEKGETITEAEKIFNGCFPLLLEQIIDNLSHKHWLSLRRVNRFTRETVDRRLHGLENFCHDFGTHHFERKDGNPQEVLEASYGFLKKTAPNLIELPGPLVCGLYLDGFPKLRKVAISDRDLCLFDHIHIDHILNGILERSHQLESLKLQGHIKREVLKFLHGKNQFPKLKELDLGSVGMIEDAIFREDSASKFPVLESISLPLYVEHMAQDFEALQKLPLLKALRISRDTTRYSFYVPIPQLRELTFINDIEPFKAEAWVAFFRGARSLRSLGIEFGQRNITLCSMIPHIPSKLVELRVGVFDGNLEQLTNILASDSIELLEVLNITIQSSLLQGFIAAINQNLVHLNSLKLGIRFETNTENRNTSKLQLEFSNLETLSIHLSSDFNYDRVLTFINSPRLKMTMKKFDLLCDPPGMLVCPQSLDKFIRDCEKLERITIKGVDDKSRMMRKITEFAFPNLRSLILE